MSMQKVIKAKYVLGLVLMSFALGCAKKTETSSATSSNPFNLYSTVGSEHQVQFQAEYESDLTAVDQIDSYYATEQIKQTVNFLFGPLTNRQLAGIQKGVQIELNTEKAYLKDTHVMIPYVYKATWLIKKEALSSGLSLPVPYSIEKLQTPNWQQCTDNSSAEHSTWSFFWYFWDPSRYGCDHVVNQQYQQVDVQIGTETVATTKSFPEYKNLIHTVNGQPTLSMTFAFGYVEDNATPNPFKDSDEGMRQFQKFYAQAKKQLTALGYVETSISQKDITAGSIVIGSKFTGKKDGVQVIVSVIANGGVDQMDIFANSYAKNHDSFFGWFGHSRVGSGFDANQFQSNLRAHPDVLSVSPNYQMVYWAGCDSYSYYTLPFFKLKADLDPTADPKGTKKLDLISNGLPSLFSFNAYNANVLLTALLNWQKPTSYQTIVDSIENNASNSGSPVLVNVLGDEDNTVN